MNNSMNNLEIINRNERSDVLGLNNFADFNIVF